MDLHGTGPAQPLIRAGYDLDDPSVDYLYVDDISVNDLPINISLDDLSLDDLSDVRNILHYVPKYKERFDSILIRKKSAPYIKGQSDNTRKGFPQILGVVSQSSPRQPATSGHNPPPSYTRVVYELAFFCSVPSHLY